MLKKLFRQILPSVGKIRKNRLKKHYLVVSHDNAEIIYFSGNKIRVSVDGNDFHKYKKNDIIVIVEKGIGHQYKIKSLGDCGSIYGHKFLECVFIGG